MILYEATRLSDTYTSRYLLSWISKLVSFYYKNQLFVFVLAENSFLEP